MMQRKDRTDYRKADSGPNLVRIGIDPGTKTGVAAYNVETKQIIACKTSGIVNVMSLITLLAYDEEFLVEIWFEDARKRKWFGNSGREKLQGAGSIKRDCSIWEEFCNEHSIKHKMIPPRDISTKMDKKLFAKITGWTGRTSEHSRDAAMIVFGS